MGYNRHSARILLVGRLLLGLSAVAAVWLGLVFANVSGAAAGSLSHHQHAAHHDMGARDADSPAGHHTPESPLTNASYHGKHQPCPAGCNCKGPMMTHCCSQSAPAAALWQAIMPLPRDGIFERRVTAVAEEESATLLPPTPPPRTLRG